LGKNKKISENSGEIHFKEFDIRYEKKSLIPDRRASGANVRKCFRNLLVFWIYLLC